MTQIPSVVVFAARMCRVAKTPLLFEEGVPEGRGRYIRDWPLGHPCCPPYGSFENNQQIPIQREILDMAVFDPDAVNGGCFFYKVL